MKKVLIVEDEEEILEILSEFLELFNCSTVKCLNPQDALKIFEQEKFDFIITDLSMPGLDGADFIKQIREKDKDIPIAVCSGFIDEQNKNKIFEAGGNYYIEKPFKLNEIKELIDKIL